MSSDAFCFLAAAAHLLLSGDVVVDEGHPLVGPLAPHAGDPGHRHLTGLDGRFCAVTAKLCLFLQTCQDELWVPGCVPLYLSSKKKYGGKQPAVTPSWLTWLSVTNSASSPTKSPACGISLTMRGMKVAWLFLCFRASEASVSSTLASMGFLTEGDSRASGVHPICRRKSTVWNTYCGGRIWCGSSSWRNTKWRAPSSSRQTEQLQSLTKQNDTLTWQQAHHFVKQSQRGHILTLSIGSIKKSLKRYHCWCVTPWNKQRFTRQNGQQRTI